MWSWRKKAVLFLVACCLAFPGCGYTLRHRLKGVFNDPRGVFVPVFDNATDQTGAEKVFTNALIRELESRGDVVLSSRDAGGMELRGVITGITYDPTVYTDTGVRGLSPYRRLPSELNVTVALSLRLVDSKTGSQLWSGSFSGFRRIEAPTDRTFDFQAPSSIGLLTQSLVEAQYPEIARDIMRDVYDEMVELF